MLETLQTVIAEELTGKQRQALVAILVQGMPLEEVARRMGTNRNALYKLLHDARRRLKKRLLAQGLSTQDLLAAARS
ncbi:MAG TPA: sigma factor-like helix-turn-helix DNA-binding protein [Anaerolineae bacterium]|nr:sigma factor-like helix-turn-helix DNA-binding protein [Anaerolineae bacterium]